jgi:hypothetical protein
MTGDSNEDHQPKKSHHVSSKPPIFYLYEFLQQRPVFFGLLAGALVGVIVASQTGWPVNPAVIGGGVAGAVIAAVILRLRSLRSS